MIDHELLVKSGYNDLDKGFATVRDMAYLNVYDEESEADALLALANKLAFRLNKIKELIEVGPQ